MNEYLKNISTLISACNNRAIEAKGICELAIKQNIKFSWHPLGFVMATLLDEGSEKVRIHLWSKSFDKAQKPTWLVHDHKFDLTSWVLSGTIKNIEYKNSASSKTHQLYSVTYNSTGSILTKLDEVHDLKIEKTQEISSGEKYKIEAGIFHQSISMSKNTTVTICHTVDKNSHTPLVIGELDGKRSYYYQRSLVHIDDLQKIISEI
ncbi:hypothetical protein [Aeromonas allosaccharophila]|uniref:Uncharacterized protein n=1 Tax=Aeromonas allosaccharophila TaxID=656 RepID=A0AAX3NY61_9GAMM|nr:hypothetical protein [Aeromonas allosaccharophila]WED78000.1 hypothetical protein PYU98_07195 [Aeromonas allosaccharophila]